MITANRLAKTVPDYGIPGYQRLGIGAQTPLATATDLTDPFPIKELEEVDGCDAITGWSASTDAAVNLNTEDGEFIEGTGALNLRKNGATTDEIQFTKSTLTAADWNDKELWLWFFISDLDLLADTGTVLEVRYGSSAGNYYSKNYEPSDLEEGGNWIRFNKASVDGTTGTPNDAAMTYLQLRLTAALSTTAWSASEVRLDHVFLADQDSYEMPFDNGPTILSDERTIRSTTRIRTAQAIGAPATNSAWYTTDGTMYGIDGYDRNDKTQREEWQFTDEIQTIDR